MQEKYLNKLEYNKILEILSTHTQTSVGKNLCLELTPLHDKDKIQRLLDETTEAVTLKYQKGNPPISYIDPIEIEMKSLESSMILSAKSLLSIAKVLKISREIKEYFYNDKGISYEIFQILANYFGSIYCNESLENKIFSDIIDENTISDNASSKLYNIRKEKIKVEQDIKDKLNSFIHSSTYSKYIQESVVTLRNDRYVIPVKEEYKSQIKGFIHDMSSSGSTVFMEPLTIFELNNKMNNLRIDENIEIEMILNDLTSLFLPYIEELRNDVRIIGRLDFIFAKANYSIELDATSPTLTNDKSINLIKARHPLISKDTVVPIDINLGITFSCLVITGPNTGGKTVTLKTVGLLCLMATSGLHIPTKENSSMCIFDNIYTDIGDEQSIQESLSTFSSHMLNIVEILNISTSNSLVLVDELGSGTDPIEGSSLAISILEHFYNNNSLIIATTHYPEIKNYALITDGFENASCEFDVENLKPTYRLLIGISGKSNAFAISKRLGLSELILNRANELLTKDNINIEDLLKNIYDDKLEIEKEKEEINKNLIQVTNLRKSLEKDNSYVGNKEKELIENAKIEARKILLNAKDTAGDIIKEMTSISDGQSLKNLNNLRNTLNDNLKSISISKTETNTNSSIKLSDIQVGLQVLVTTLMQNGIILSLPNKSNQVQVQIGSLKMNVNICDLAKSTNLAEIKKSNNINNNSNTFKSQNISTKINVIGQNVEEANFVIDKYLDDCIIARLSQVQIVHGKGTGKLREGIHVFLKKHPHVKSYRMGNFGEGEMGVTIVELK